MMIERQAETQKALITMLFQEIENQLGIAPTDIEITIKEQPKHCWGIRRITGDEVQNLGYNVNV